MTPEEFEKASLEWIKRQGDAYPNGCVEHNVTIPTRNGNYQVDGRIRFYAYGLPFTIIVECKLYKHSVNREKVVVLLDKVRELGAHKGILVTSASFQSGAIQFAKNNGITLVCLKGTGNDYSAEYFTDFSEEFNQESVVVRFPRMITTAPSDIPRSYVPREIEKRGILSTLYSGESMVIHGIGGIGKSMFAKDIVKTIRQTPSKECGYDAIAWINCAGGSLRDALTSSLLETKNIRNPADAWTAVSSTLDRYQKKLLIVADNLETLPEEDREQLNDLPCCVLATSRNSKCGALLSYSLPDLNEEDCATLFMHFYKGSTDMHSLREIIRLADCHAVTVELLAKLANREAAMLSDFLQNLVNHGFHLSQESVAADHQALYKERKILEQISILFTMARCTSVQSQLLTKLSILPSIPFQFSQVSKWLGLTSRSSLEQLADLGWITAAGEYSPTYQIHATVAAAIREQTKPTLYQICRPVVHNLLSEMQLGKHEYLYQKKKYITFAWSVADLLHGHMCDEIDAEFLEMVASIFDVIGNLNKAYDLYMQAIGIRKRLKHDPKLLIYDWRSIGDILIQLSDYKNAEKYLQRALKTANKEPKSLRSIMLVKHSLAFLAVKAGDYRLAVRRYAAAKKVYDTNNLADSYDKAVFYIDYAGFYRDFAVKGATRKAEEYFKTGVSIFESAKLTREPEYAAALCQFGLFYRDVGNLSAALAIERKALKHQKKLFDDKSPDIADTYATIGLLEYDLDLMGKAEEDTLKALNIYRELYSEQHESVASSYNNLGLIYATMPGREQKAEDMYFRALKIRLNLYDRQPHLKLAESYNNLAMLYRRSGYPERARECYDQAMAIYDELGAVIEDLANVLDNSANLSMDEGEVEKAYREALLGLSIRNSISLDSYNCSFSHNTLGLIYYKWEDYGKARMHFEKAVSLKKKALGKVENESLATAHFNLALTLEELDIPLAIKEYEISERMYRKLNLIDDAEMAKEYRINLLNRCS